MDDKKFQRALDALLEQQAKFYTDLQELKGIQKEAEKRTNILERVCLNLYNSSVEQGKNIAEQAKNIAEQGKNIAELTVDIKELREAQKETDERLNAVIFMAEKFFSGQNGKSGKSKSK